MTFIGFVKDRFTAVRTFLSSKGSSIDLKVFRNYIVLILGSGATRLISFATSVILARQLGPEGFGEFSVFFALMVAFWTGTTFIDSTYVRYANTNLQERESYLRGSYVLKSAFCLLLAALAYPLTWVLSHYIFQKPELELPIFIAVLCGAALQLLSMRAAVYQATEDFYRFAGLNALFYVLVFALLLVLLFGKIPLNTTLVYNIYLIVALLIGTLSFLKLYKLSKPLHLERAVLSRILSFAKWLFAANLTYMVFQRLDVLILARYVNLEALGQYGAALRIAAIASLMTGTLSALLLPRASHTRNSPPALKHYLKQTALISLTLVFIITILWFIVPIVVYELFGNVYKQAIPLARIILIGTAFVALYTPLSQLFLADDNPKKMFYLGLVKLNTILWLALLLVPSFGVWGAAWVVVASEFSAMIYTLIALKPWRMI
jgi:O-antigen/teichoic acid export membrane protein